MVTAAESGPGVSRLSFVAIGAVLLAALILLPGLLIGPSLDAAVFAGIAEQLKHGDRLYVDAWDHKPPAIYFLNASAQFLVPWLKPWAASWVVSVLGTAAAATGLFVSLRRFGIQPFASVIAAAVATVFMAQYLTSLGGGLTEPLATACVSWAVALALSPASGGQVFAIGALLGLANLFSFQLAPAVIPVAYLWNRSQGRNSPTGDWLYLLTGAALPWIVAIIASVATGTLPAAIDAVIRYPVAYRQASQAFGWDLSKAPAAWTFLSAAALLSASLAGLVALRRSHRLGVVAVPMLMWVFLVLATFVLQGRFIAHYAIPLAIPLGVLAGTGYDSQLARRRRVSGLARATIAVVAVVPMVIAGAGSVLGSRYDFMANNELRSRLAPATEFVDANSAACASILVWGNRPELYLAADRDPALPYRFMFPLTTEGYASGDLIQRLETRLEADPPVLVVDAGSLEPGTPGFLPLLIPRPVVREGRETNLLDPLRDFIRARYYLAATVSGWPIYRLRGMDQPGSCGRSGRSSGTPELMPTSR